MSTEEQIKMQKVNQYLIDKGICTPIGERISHGDCLIELETLKAEFTALKELNRVQCNRLQDITKWALRAREALEFYGDTDRWSSDHGINSKTMVEVFRCDDKFGSDKACEVLASAPASVACKATAPDMLERQKEGG